MTKTEMLKLIRGFVANRKIALQNAGIEIGNVKKTAIRHLEFHMPQENWPEDRIRLFVFRNWEYFETIMPHTDKFKNYREKMDLLILDCLHQ